MQLPNRLRFLLRPISWSSPLIESCCRYRKPAPDPACGPESRVDSRTALVADELLTAWAGTSDEESVPARVHKPPLPTYDAKDLRSLAAASRQPATHPRTATRPQPCYSNSSNNAPLAALHLVKYSACVWEQPTRFPTVPKAEPVKAVV